MRLPLSARLERDGQALVFVVDEATGIVSERQVTIVARSERSITVSAGLGPGTRVVTAGVNSLSPGQKVKIENGRQAHEVVQPVRVGTRAPLACHLLHDRARSPGLFSHLNRGAKKTQPSPSRL